MHSLIYLLNIIYSVCEDKFGDVCRRPLSALVREVDGSYFLNNKVQSYMYYHSVILCLKQINSSMLITFAFHAPQILSDFYYFVRHKAFYSIVRSYPFLRKAEKG